MWKKEGKTVIIADHRLYWLKDLCDRVIFLEDGRIKLDLSMDEFRQYGTEDLARLGLRTLEIDSLEYKVQKDVHLSGKITLKDFSYRYDRKSDYALKVDELTVPRGAIIAVIGHNGAGKSTFSRCLCGLNRHFKGRIEIDSKRVQRIPDSTYMVMQDVNHQLFSETVLGDVTLKREDVDLDEAKKVLESFDLLEYKDRHPMSLSGGQKQRVAISAAVLADKEILIFDEPTSGLDFNHMEETADELLAFLGKKTVFIVTHDLELIMKCCTHALHIEDGKVKDFYALNNPGVEKLRDFFIQ